MSSDALCVNTNVFIHNREYENYALYYWEVLGGSDLYLSIHNKCRSINNIGNRSEGRNMIEGIGEGGGYGNIPLKVHGGCTHT